MTDINRGRPITTPLTAVDDFRNHILLLNEFIDIYHHAVNNNTPLDTQSEKALTLFQSIFPEISKLHWLRDPGIHILTIMLSKSTRAYSEALTQSLSKHEFHNFLCDRLDIDMPSDLSEIALKHSFSSDEISLENSPSILARELVAALFGISVRTLESKIKNEKIIATHNH